MHSTSCLSPFLRRAVSRANAKRLVARTYATKPLPSELPQPRLDYRSITENVTSKSLNALNRKAPIPNDSIQDLARSHTEFKRIYNELAAKRNARSIAGEKMKRSVQNNDNQGKEAARNEALLLKTEIKALEAALEEVENHCLTLALVIPNDTHPSSPLGPDPVTISTHGPDPMPADPIRDHLQICRQFDLLDLESGATVTGSSWYFLVNEAALLEQALTNYALSVAIQHGFTPMTTPDVVKSDVASRCGFQPRDDANVSHMYHITPTNPASPQLVLSGTAEIPLGGMFANKLFPPGALPKKIVGIGHAFRAEAGARSVDTRGLYRVHQFTKVELFAVTTAEGSESMMEEIKNVQQSILFGLELPFRILDMPTEELGSSAYRKYDMEAWMPGRGTWGEVTSLSNCTDYQSRRLHIRYRPQQSSGVHHEASTSLPFAHTLNGTAAAIPRLIVALIENGAIFNDKGEITGIKLPRALQPFWICPLPGRDIIQWS